MQKRMIASPRATADVPWDLLRSFLAVLHAGSVGKAALTLGASQPSVSRHVKQLEERLGAELFERRAQRLVPTALAQQLGDAARGMRDGADDVARLLAARTHEAAGSVRISASRIAATHLLPALLVDLARDPTAPSVELLAEDELTNLSERQADLAVRLVRPTQKALITRRVGTIHFGLYATRGYLETRPALERASDLAHHLVIGFDRSPLMVRRARALGFETARGAFGFRSDDRLVHWAAIRAGIGVGMLPTYLAERDRAFVRVLASMRLTPGGVWLVGRREVLARPPVRRVYEVLRDGLTAVLQRASP